MDQIDITKSTELDLADLKSTDRFHLSIPSPVIPEFSAIENVMMPLLIGGELKQSAQIRALDLLKRIGLGERIEHRPGELSGGEQQRVALARAIVRSPQILLADEPTGNLDQRTGDEVRQLIRQLQIEERMSAIIVTHNERLAENCDRILRLENGRLIEL
ncbi:MAG: ATP-binding cassette domain-containing protein [Acidobacteria bacterium]|nr:ATP-binding cassette domain-containing protein [Acidobacteriota bacterium]